MTDERREHLAALVQADEEDGMYLPSDKAEDLTAQSLAYRFDYWARMAEDGKIRRTRFRELVVRELERAGVCS